MSVEQLLERVRQQEPLSFAEVMAVIEAHYDFTPTAFSNGLDQGRVMNAADQNQGSCKLLAFAQLQGLDQQQTLHLFGDYYYQEVLNDPQGSGHANIRAFIRDGWAGVRFEQSPLTPKQG